MIAVLAVCAVLLPNPSDLQPGACVTHDAQPVHQSSEKVAMPPYQVEQIIWYQYYGEWAPGGNTAEADASTAKQDEASGNGAARKTSAK